MESVSGMQTFKCQEGNVSVWNKAVQSDNVSMHTTFRIVSVIYNTQFKEMFSLFYRRGFKVFLSFWVIFSYIAFNFNGQHIGIFLAFVSYFQSVPRCCYFITEYSNFFTAQRKQSHILFL